MILDNLFADPGFYMVSIIAIVFALVVVLEENIIRAGFALVVSFCAVAGAYFLMQAPFVAASQILIYAVGITLVIIFGLMLTNQKDKLVPAEGSLMNSFSTLIAVGVFFTFAAALTGNKWGIIESPLSCPKNTEIIGLKMLSSYILPFELVSVLLLIALVGAIVIAKKDKNNA